MYFCIIREFLGDYILFEKWWSIMINLNSFFGNESSTEIELLQVLYKNSGFMDIEELSARLNIDRRSVYKYFELLQNNSYNLKSTTNEIFISKRGRGYKFAGTKKDYKLLYKKIVESNPFFELLTSLLLNNEVSITKFSIDHFMSESKFLKRLYELNLLFEEYGLSVKRRAGQARLMGDEAKIRFFAVAFFWKVYHGSYWPFPSISKKKCDQLVSKIFTKNKINYNEIGQNLTSYAFAITILRVRRGLRIDPKKIDSIKKSPFIDDEVFSIILNTEDELTATLLKEFRSSYHLDETEITFLLFWFYSNSNFYLVNPRLKEYLNHFTKKKGYLFSVSKLQRKLPEISRFKTLSLTTKQMYLSTLLAGSMSVELFGKTSFTVTGYEIEEYIQKNAPKLLLRATELLTQASIYSDDPDKKYGLALQIAIANTLIINPTDYMKKIKIKIETDLPTALEFTVVERIKNTFKSFYNIELSNNLSYQDADFCLSTNPLSEMDRSLETLLINAQVTESDIVAINQKILDILNEKDT